MITKLLELIQELLKDKMDKMQDNNERSMWLKDKIDVLPEAPKAILIKWFLDNYRDK